MTVTAQPNPQQETPSRLQKLVLIALALVFTLGLAFASVELPSLVDRSLQALVMTPGDDSHANPVALYQTELFLTHFHLRLIGYLCLGLTILIILVGFVGHKSGLLAVGAAALMLPVFAQFASVMFFLAGLGLLNIIWLPVLDVSFDGGGLGLIIRAPYDMVSWLLRQVGINAYWPLVYLFIGGGLLVFFVGTIAWLWAKSRGANVAGTWIYRFSRHPQYLGWILWTYGLFLLLMSEHYPRRSWGIGASLPWLLSTLVILGVALIEELNMETRFGESYRKYRQKTPFLFPLPRFVSRLLTTPVRVFFRKEWPGRIHEVATLLVFYAAVMVGASLFFYGGGIARLSQWVEGASGRQERMESAVQALKDSPNWRERRAIANRLTEYGESAVPVFVALLAHEDPDIRALAADRLGELTSQAAIEPLIEALLDADNDVRRGAIRALARIGARGAAGPILMLAGDPDKYTRRVVGWALAELKAAGAVDVLLAQLQDSLVWMRVAAAEDLGTVGSALAVPNLVNQLSHESNALRRTVVVALMRIGSPEALDPLRKARQDVDWEVRVYAEEAVKHIEAIERRDDGTR